MLIEEEDEQYVAGLEADPAFIANERLSRNRAGDVVLRLKGPFRAWHVGCVG